ncbi:MAG TPA: MarR family winged helix-turn-helix transcriptional regulator [Xanthomonadales bacterium]|nr:MarR family winged helix-turn-helix transcriptional regulator [Xanthomonadales bacterium]
MPSFIPSSTKTPDFLQLLHSLASAYQAVSMFEAKAHRESGNGMTTSQADVIFTLGNTDGMTCADIGNATLITKGTLTGVIDRLFAKGLVERWEDAYDARRTIIALTKKGERMYQKAFPPHLALLKSRLDEFSAADRRKVTQALETISDSFSKQAQG